MIFFGTPVFAARILECLLNSPHEVVAVVTQPDRPKGRGKNFLPPPVKEVVQTHTAEITLFQPEKASTDAFAENLAALQADIFVVAAYGEIIKTNILSIPPKGCINVHPSLLPKYRGATPIQACLQNGDNKTGVTIMEMVLKMDAGDIIEVEKIPIDQNITFGELEEKLIPLSCRALLRALEKIEKGTATTIPQREEEATFVKKISQETRKIDWTQGAKEIHNQVRSLSPRPGAFCQVEIKGQIRRLLIKRTRIAHEEKANPREVLKYEQGRWCVGTGRGALWIEEVQLEGKRATHIKNFILGYPEAPKIIGKH